MRVVENLGDDLAPRLGVAPELAFGQHEVAPCGREQIVHEPGWCRQLHADRRGAREAGLELGDRQGLREPMDQRLQPALSIGEVVTPRRGQRDPIHDPGGSQGAETIHEEWLAMLAAAVRDHVRIPSGAELRCGSTYAR